MSLPAGASSTGARFAGEVWTPPAADPGSTPDRPYVRVLLAQLDTSGRMVATLPGSVNVVRLVQRMSVQAASAGRCMIYTGSIAPSNVLTGTLSGDFDENEALTPYVITEGLDLIFHWESTPASAQARVEYREV